MGAISQAPSCPSSPTRSSTWASARCVACIPSAALFRWRRLTACPIDRLQQVVFATVGCLFATGEFVAATVRQKDDAVNAAVGGLLVGAVPAILKKNARLGAATSVLSAAAMGTATFWYAKHSHAAKDSCMLG